MLRTKIIAALLVCLLGLYSNPLLAQQSAVQVPAFPGAEGAGMFATGGRGGEVVHVINLNADGPGSLAEAVSQPNRIVVFDVSGIIDLTITRNGTLKSGKIVMSQPNITLVGQTAPGEGICLKGGCLDISAENIIIRHIRSRRGWVVESDSGDAIEVKPVAVGVKTKPAGLSQEEFDRIKDKKEERGKVLQEFAPLANILIDHCSTSWATDENLTVTHADRTTVSWCIAAEGCDYANPKQTPPNHSEGSLWGSSAPDGRSTMHHMLYAHNRLRNPRTTGGADVPAVLNMYHNVVYNWSEFATHTGSERVFLNWLHNYYKPGPSTSEEIRTHAFEFHGDPGARVYARGNIIEASPTATADNRHAIEFDRKLSKLSADERATMIVNKPFPNAPAQLATAEEAYESVLADAGATFPARDMVDFRIINSVRTGTGRVIEKETDLPEAERWPDYRSLPRPTDTDNDGLPDFWERQFRLDPEQSGDGARIARGYANIEHYFNNTDPSGGTTPIVFIAAAVPRARQDAPGQWRISRSGDLSHQLTVKLTIRGDAKSGADFTSFSERVTIPSGAKSVTIPLLPLTTAEDNRTVIVSLITLQAGCHVGCPAESLIVIRK